MVVYLILFIICIFLSYIIPRLPNKKIRYLLLGIVVLLLSIIGGCRDTIIGTDVEVYGTPWFEKACEYDNIIEYVKNMGKEDTGYVVLNFIVSRFTNNVNVFLFVLQLICNTLIIVTLYKYRKKAPFWFSILCYIGIYYLRSYNFLRQSIALAIVFFSLRYLEQNKLLKFIISVIIASQFHFTTIVCVALYPLKYIVAKDNKICNFILIVGIIALIIISLNLVNVIEILHDIGIVGQRIYEYTTRFLNTGDGFNIIETGFRVFFILLYALRFKELNSKFKLNKFLFVCSIIDVILFQFRNVIQYSDRIAFYFGYMTILLIPQIPDTLALTYRNKVILKAAFAVIILIFWYYKFIYAGSCEVYPYSSSILGIN